MWASLEVVHSWGSWKAVSRAHFPNHMRTERNMMWGRYRRLWGERMDWLGEEVPDDQRLLSVILRRLAAHSGSRQHSHCSSRMLGSLLQRLRMILQKVCPVTVYRARSEKEDPSHRTYPHRILGRAGPQSCGSACRLSCLTACPLWSRSLVA